MRLIKSASGLICVVAFLNAAAVIGEEAGRDKEYAADLRCEIVLFSPNEDTYNKGPFIIRNREVSGGKWINNRG